VSAAGNFLATRLQLHDRAVGEIADALKVGDELEAGE